MRAAALWAAAWCAGLTMAQGQSVVPDRLKPENRTISASRQFTAFGGTRSERGELLRRAEEFKQALGRELRVADDWKAPMLFVVETDSTVRRRPSPVTVRALDAGGAGRKIQLDIAAGRLGERAAIDEAIVRGLLLERSLREQQFRGNRLVDPPDWLVVALATRLGRPAERDARLQAALLEGKGMPRLDRFLRQNASALSGRARDVHAAESLALYDSLAELPGGRAQVVANLTLAEPARDPLQRFAQTWPELAGDPPRLARLWALAVARLSTPVKLEFLGAEETGRQLEGLLDKLGAPEAGADRAELWLALSRTDEGRFRLAQSAGEVRRLAFRAHPLYAPLVGQYQLLLEDLSRKRRRGLAKRLRETDEVRMALDERSAEITDFMNWYQANRDSGGADVMVVDRRPAAPVGPRRNDRISRYLDSVEQRGW